MVGGGPVAARKAATLLGAGAEVTMVAPAFSTAALALHLDHVERTYEQGEAAQYQLVIAATGIVEVDEAVFDDAEAAGVLVNAADDPAHCRFLLPAVHRIGTVSVAVSTDGASPALAVWLRDRLADELGDDTAELAELVGRARRALHDAGESTEGRDWRGLIETLGGAADPDAVISAWLNEQLRAHVSN